MNRKQRLIDPTQDLDRHVSESLGARSQRNIVEDIDNVSRTPRTKRLQVLENGTPIADVDAINLTGGVSTSVQGRMVTANFTGGVSSTGTGTITVQSNDVDVDTAVTTIDFSSHFTVTSSPSGEANVSLAGSGATIIVQEGDSTVDSAVGTLDFDASDFNVTSSPSGEANIALAYGTSAGTPAEGNHNHTGVYQPLDTELTALASTTSAADALPYFTGSGTATTTTLTAAARTILDDATTTDIRTTIGAQPLSTNLTALSALGANGLVASTGIGTYSLRTLTAGSAKLSVTNGNGSAGNPTVDLGTVAFSDLSDGFAAVQRLIAIGAPM